MEGLAIDAKEKNDKWNSLQTVQEGLEAPGEFGGVECWWEAAIQRAITLSKPVAISEVTE